MVAQSPSCDNITQVFRQKTVIDDVIVFQGYQFMVSFTKCISVISGLFNSTGF